MRNNRIFMEARRHHASSCPGATAAGSPSSFTNSSSSGEKAVGYACNVCVLCVSCPLTLMCCFVKLPCKLGCHLLQHLTSTPQLPEARSPERLLVVMHHFFLFQLSGFLALFYVTLNRITCFGFASFSSP
ncbi:hypothetical protein Ancab_038659 [Ancistrocladus abbreviatus]